jgi:hypothetical protein
MRKLALLVCLAISAAVLAGAALAGTGGQGNVNVTTDTACPATAGSVNTVTDSDPINVWISPSTPTGDELTWTISSENSKDLFDGTLTFVCTDTNTGFELWSTGFDAGALSANLGKGNKTSESYTISVFDETASTNVGGDSFRRV